MVAAFGFCPVYDTHTRAVYGTHTGVAYDTDTRTANETHTMVWCAAHTRFWCTAHSRANVLFTQGPGVLLTQGPCVLLTQGPGVLLTQGPGALLTQGPGVLLTQGPGALLTQGPGALLTQGPVKRIPLLNYFSQSPGGLKSVCICLFCCYLEYSGYTKITVEAMSPSLVTAMGQDIRSVYTILCSVLIATIQVVQCQPTLEEVSAVQCPTERPFKCLPYGSCCGGDQYCSTETRTCESCFPRLPPTDLLAWCRNVGLYNVSRMQHETCKLACQAKFTVQDLAADVSPSVDQGMDNESNSCKDQEDYWYHRFMVMCIVSVILLCSTVTFLSLLCYIMFGRRRRRSSRRGGLDIHQGPRSRAHIRRQLSHRNEVNDLLDDEASPRYTDPFQIRISTDSKSSHENEYVTPIIFIVMIY
ncbi:hypothetical protein Btru_030546 [Bulinus truncatus]|nr:hypothetical protein Btru_030546 [Bulinus truncatus]